MGSFLGLTDAFIVVGDQSSLHGHRRLPDDDRQALRAHTGGAGSTRRGADRGPGARDRRAPVTQRGDGSVAPVEHLREAGRQRSRGATGPLSWRRIDAARRAGPAPPRPRSVSVVGWSWAGVSLLEGAYAVYLGSWALAYGGSQAAWVLTIGFGVLAAGCARLARAILQQPSRRMLLVSLAVAGGHLLFAIRGIFLGPPQPFLVMGAIAIAIGWISYRALDNSPAGARRA